MKRFNQFISEGLTQDVKELLDAAAEKVIPELAKKWDVWDHKMSMGSWSKPDGSRYKNFNYFYLMTDWNWDTVKLPKKNLNWDKVLDQIWAEVEKKATKKVKLTQEFSSMKPVDAIFYKRHILVKSGHRIEYGSKSRLKNSSVWSVVE